MTEGLEGIDHPLEKVSFYNLVGDIAIKEASKDSIQVAEEAYLKSSEILKNCVGEDSIDYMFNQVDLGDI